MQKTLEELQRDLDAHVWYHSIDFGNGLITHGVKTADVLAAEEAAVFDGVDIRGRSVFDIGAWNGFFSFAAKRRGARRVLAADKFVWEAPLVRGRETFELARTLLGETVETLVIDVPDIDKRIGQFDIVLFLDVFYHLFDPVHCLRRLSECASDLLVVRTHQNALTIGAPAMIFYPGTTLEGDPSNWWGPNPKLMHELLLEVGFKKVYYQDHALAGRERGIFHAFRSDEALAKLVANIPKAWSDLGDPSIWNTTLKVRTIESLYEEIALLREDNEQFRAMFKSRSKLLKTLFHAILQKL